MEPRRASGKDSWKLHISEAPRLTGRTPLARIQQARRGRTCASAAGCRPSPRCGGRPVLPHPLYSIYTRPIAAAKIQSNVRRDSQRSPNQLGKVVPGLVASERVGHEG